MMQIMTPEIPTGSRALPVHMRAALFLLAAATLGSSCAVAPDAATKGGNVELRTIGKGTNAADADSASAMAVFDDVTYQATWAAKINEGEVPKVDLAKEAVVFVFAGMRNTGGYSVDVRGAKIEGETLILDAVVHGPPPGGMVSQVITYPYAVVAVTPRAFRSVRWYETAQAPRR
jgi:hypothetical protein